MSRYKELWGRLFKGIQLFNATEISLILNEQEKKQGA